ncbi:hypothetical protein KM043_002780 [Ampulex compressa]|nr:hypothetical protein KM043_002780 [Ampulex compressa]
MAREDIPPLSVLEDSRKIEERDEFPRSQPRFVLGHVPGDDRPSVGGRGASRATSYASAALSKSLEGKARAGLRRGTSTSGNRGKSERTRTNWSTERRTRSISRRARVGRRAG